MSRDLESLRRTRRSRAALAAALAFALAGAARAQDKAEKPERVRRDAPTESLHARSVFRFPAKPPHADEETWVLLDDAHGTLSLPRRARGARHDAPPSSLRRLDVRAEAIVVHAPIGRSTTMWRTLYAEGFVRLEAVEIPIDREGKPRKGATPRPFVLEADRLFLDLVAEKGYAVKARVRAPKLPGSRRATGIQLRAEKLRLDGLEEFVAENAAASICEFGLPHLEAVTDRLEVLLPAEPQKPLPAASVALGDAGGAVVALRQPDRLWLARDLRPGDKQSVEEGSDALFHEAREPREIQMGTTGVRVRPPFLFGEEGAGIPLFPGLYWKTSWILPDIRVGQSSRFGWFGLVAVKAPLVEPALVHEEGGRKHLRDGLRIDTKLAVDAFEERGVAGDVGFQWEKTSLNDDRKEQKDLKGDLRFFGLVDQGDVDRNGTPVPDDRNRYWGRGLHQEWLPGGVQVDAELSKQSDRNFLNEFQRRAARTDKPQETYVYARRSWDEIGARLIGRFRLNDFQTYQEELPRARVDVIATPLFTTEYLGGAYLTLGLEGAHLRQRFDTALPFTEEPRIGRGDFEGRLDYKLALGPFVARAFGLGRYTAWSRSAPRERAIDRFVGSTGAFVTTWLHREFLDTPFGDLRHVVIPTAGYENRLLVSRPPEQLVQFDSVEQLREVEYGYLRLRNRIQLANPAHAEGGGARDVIDLGIEGRYFPHKDQNLPDQRLFSALIFDMKVWAGDYGFARAQCEMDPNIHRLLVLELSATATPFPWLRLEGAYREIRGATRAVGWGVEWKMTPSWTVRFEEQYDLEQRSFLRHRGVLRRTFHEFAVEVTGSFDPILNDKQITVGIVPAFESEQSDPWQSGGRLAGIAGN